MGDRSGNKKFKPTFILHHGEPILIQEEVRDEKIGNEVPDKDKLEELLHQLAMSNQPGLTLQWHDPKDVNDQGQEFHLPADNEAKSIPDKITVRVEQESDDKEVDIMPPVKYFQPDGTPVYYFQDPMTGHKYWDECNCEGCYEDCLLLNDDLSPKQLKKMYALENPPKKPEELSPECSPSKSNN